jgi:hypothetical protein
MQRKLILGAVLALLLAMATVPLAFADDGTRGDDDHDGDDVRILTVTTRTLQEAQVDAPPSGVSVGDRFVFSETVFRRDKEIGVTGADCVVVLFTPGSEPEEPEAFTIHCVATASLPKGQITVQGLVDLTEPGPLTIAITGGTGAYRTAHGEVEEVMGESPGEDRLTFKLILGHDREHDD